MTRAWKGVADAERTAMLLHPERFAPNGEQLKDYPQVCPHSSAEKRAGTCGDGWQHRLIGWRLAQQPKAEAAAAPERDGPPDPDEPEWIDDQDAPYGRVRGEA